MFIEGKNINTGGGEGVKATYKKEIVNRNVKGKPQLDRKESKLYVPALYIVLQRGCIPLLDLSDARASEYRNP
jgi:hypothetical protein